MAIVGAALLIGILAYSSLSAHRAAPSVSQPIATSAATAAAQPVIALRSPSPSHTIKPPIESMQQSSAPVSTQPRSIADPAQLQSPGLVIDLAESAQASSAMTPSKLDAVPTNGSQRLVPAGGAPVGSKANANEEFQSRVERASADATVATRLHNTALVVTQGTVIPAILETAVNSDLPGFVRAVVSRDVRGFDGSKVLIPRGSKLIGQYKSGAAAGQSRAFVIWSRLITPQGVSIELGSPAIDEAGGAGVKGETNTHFLTRFGSSVLLSVVDAGLNIAVAKASNGFNSVVIGSPQQATNAATVALQRNIDIPTTITLMQGTPIRAFVARDLDFVEVSEQP